MAAIPASGCVASTRVAASRMAALLRVASARRLGSGDSIRLDRDRLIAHLRPVRKNLRDYRFEIHEVIADGDRIAARMTIHATMRKTGPLTTELFLFGEFTPDGRLRRAEQLTRIV
ncbi:nuclear transport factor 2 family protein [Nocardia fluminea]|uniref:nuclear transport factor 2 family protein n=1 Tax=Nocardia fluminea TaxID=134984 RepID=UPI00366B6DD5